MSANTFEKLHDLITKVVNMTVPPLFFLENTYIQSTDQTRDVSRVVRAQRALTEPSATRPSLQDAWVQHELCCRPINTRSTTTLPLHSFAVWALLQNTRAHGFLWDNALNEAQHGSFCKTTSATRAMLQIADDRTSVTQKISVLGIATMLQHEACYKGSHRRKKGQKMFEGLQ